MAKPYFTRSLFTFLKDLAANNDRDWFQANKDRYESDLRQPAIQFIVDFGPHLGKISRRFTVDPRPSGGSLFRIHRDVRFSKDKSPYKTHAAIQFRHEAGKDAHAPGFYLHLEPGNCGVAAGVWRPPTPAVRAIREAIAAQPKKWQSIIDQGEQAGLGRFGEQLKRVPAGYPKDHPLADELRWKDYGYWQPMKQQDIVAPDALERIAGVYQDTKPMMKFLCEAMDQPF